MTSVALIPGAGGLGWYWHRVQRDLQGRGYDAIAVDPRPHETPGEWWDNVALSYPEQLSNVIAGYLGTA